MRKFGGKTSDFTDRAEEAFEKRHLKAYLAGKRTFKCGTKQGKPVYYEVLIIEREKTTIQTT